MNVELTPMMQLVRRIEASDKISHWDKIAALDDIIQMSTNKDYARRIGLDNAEFVPGDYYSPLDVIFLWSNTLQGFDFWSKLNEAGL